MRMKLAIGLAALGLTAFSTAETIRFDSTRPGALPAGWTAVIPQTGRAPRWEVRPDSSAPSKPNVLAQLSSERAENHVPMAIFDVKTVQDGEVSVKFKTVSGRSNQAAGLVWRYQNPNNYYLVRANALEDNIAMYKVQDGKPTLVVPKGRSAKSSGVTHKIPARTWSILKVSFRKSRFEVYFDHRKVFEAEDSTFRQAGKVGLWTKADSVTYFDDFQLLAK